MGSDDLALLLLKVAHEGGGFPVCCVVLFSSCNQFQYLVLSFSKHFMRNGMNIAH